MDGIRPEFFLKTVQAASKNAARFCNENRSWSFRKFFSIAIVIAISNEKSLIDFAGKNAERFF
jgi:hypothetical protein